MPSERRAKIGFREVRWKRNDTARQFTSPKSGLPVKRNVLNFGTGGYEHELAKFNLCWEALKDGHEFITEARGKDGNVRDFVDLDTGEIKEIETSEERAKRHGEDVTVVKLWEKNYMKRR